MGGAERLGRPRRDERASRPGAQERGHRDGRRLHAQALPLLSAPLLRARGARRAASAHVVVTNHALLFRDVVADGGSCRRSATGWSTRRTPPRARRASSSRWSAPGSSSRWCSPRSGGPQRLIDTFAQAGGIRRATPSMLIMRRSPRWSAPSPRARRSPPRSSSSCTTCVARARTPATTRSEVRVDAACGRAPWGTVSRVGRSLAMRLEAALAAGRRLVTLLEAGSEATEATCRPRRSAHRIASQHIALVTVLEGEADEYVYHLTVDRRPGGRADRLAASRLDVGEALAEDFFPRVRSAVFTSATIAAGDDFGHFARSVGLDRLGPERWSAVRLRRPTTSSARWRRSFPPISWCPAAGEYLGRLETLLFELHLAMDGSVLTLFTNRRDMDHLYRVLAPRLAEEGLGLLVQSRGVSAKRLRDEFLADERVSLFATKSFWEGFDARGDTLRCVVVPKLPFGTVRTRSHASVRSATARRRGSGSTCPRRSSSSSRPPGGSSARRPTRVSRDRRPRACCRRATGARSSLRCPWPTSSGSTPSGSSRRSRSRFGRGAGA
jgi:ATP-dependent DNA helicase DinG